MCTRYTIQKNHNETVLVTININTICFRGFLLSGKLWVIHVEDHAAHCLMARGIIILIVSTTLGPKPHLDLLTEWTARLLWWPDPFFFFRHICHAAAVDLKRGWPSSRAVCRSRSMSQRRPFQSSSQTVWTTRPSGEWCRRPRWDAQKPRTSGRTFATRTTVYGMHYYYSNTAVYAVYATTWYCIPTHNN